MNKTVIIYDSYHQKNTEKLISAITKKYPEIRAVKAGDFDSKILLEYEQVGLASGIYYNKLSKKIQAIMDEVMKSDIRKVFYIYTSGIGKMKGYEKRLAELTEKNNKICPGIFGCKGFDTFGPFKLIGGLNKDRPNEEDIDEAIAFCEKEILKENRNIL